MTLTPITADEQIRIAWSSQITCTFTVKADRNRHHEGGVVWNNIVLYFQQFTKSCREKAFFQPHRGRAFTRRTHRERRDLSPRKTEHVLLTATGGGLNQKLHLDVDAGSLRISVVPCEFRGFRVWSTEVNKAVGGWRVLEAGYVTHIGRGNVGHVALVFSLVFWFEIKILLQFLLNLTPDFSDALCSQASGFFSVSKS